MAVSIVWEGSVAVPSDQKASVNPVPEHLHTVTPRLVVRDGAAAIDFYRAAFGAVELGERFTGRDGEVIHAELRIGDSVVMITEERADGGPSGAAGAPGAVADDDGSSRASGAPGAVTDDDGSSRASGAPGAVTAIMATYWDDVDAAWSRAVAAGAEVVFPLDDHFYGERGGRLRDPLGQQWMLSSRTELLSPEEMRRRAAELFAEG